MSILFSQFLKKFLTPENVALQAIKGKSQNKNQDETEAEKPALDLFPDFLFLFFGSQHLFFFLRHRRGLLYIMVYIL